MAGRAIPTGSRWLAQIWNAQAAKNGGIVRRQVSSVKQFATVKELKQQVKARGFHMIRSGDQYLIFCHNGEFRMIC